MSVLINIDVPDLEAATEFYTGAFDLTVSRRFGAGAIELAGWPSPVYLLHKPAGSIGAGDQPRTYSRHWTPVHLDVVVDRIDAAVARLLAAGAVLEHAARPTPYGHIAMVADPFGNGLCLIQFAGRGYDELAG